MTNKKQNPPFYIKENDKISNRKSIIFLSVGLIFIILGLLLLLTYSCILDYIINQHLIFQPGRESFEKWKEPDSQIYFDFYMFNWTNPEDINDPSKKPKFEEVGPYRYKVKMKKTNITYNAENETITYQNQRIFYYDEASSRNHSDVINSINVVALSAAYYGKDYFFVKPFVGSALSGSSIFVRKQVRELLFDGYDDNLLSLAKMFPISSLKVVPDKFGWFYIVNNTIGIDGVYNIDVKNDENFGKLKNFNYQNKTEFYQDKCSNVQVSAGELYPRNLKPSTLSAFHPDMCRPMQLYFDKQENVNGVLGYKYISSAEFLDNGALNKENKCYCKEKCLPPGVSPTCSLDYPMYYSLPHFYNADPSYVEAVEGLKPNKDLHDYFYTVEPKTGATLNASAALQFNLLLEPMSFDLYENVPKLLFPVFWFKQSVILTDDIYSGLIVLDSIPSVCQILAIILIIIGSVWVALTLLYIIYNNNKIRQKREKRKEEVPLQRKC